MNRSSRVTIEGLIHVGRVVNDAWRWFAWDIEGARIEKAEGNVRERHAGDFTFEYAELIASLAGQELSIDGALNKPGKTIVEVQIGPLLRRGGVLQRLEAQHVAIEGPAG